MDLGNKKAIREMVLKKRDELNPNLKEELDNNIFTRLINSNFYKESQSIFSFVSFGSEVDTIRIIGHALKEGRMVCVPKIPSRDKGMEVYSIRGFDELKEGYYKILEPVEGLRKVSGEEIDLILMPGVAFDRQGGRVGYGAGFYDRYLRSMTKNINKIALAYDFQLINRVPTDEFDVSIDGIITDREFIMFSK